MSDPNTPVAFNLASAQLIQQTVKKVQSMSTDTGGARDPSRPLNTSFWAMITGANDLTGTFYNWVACVPTANAATPGASNTLATNLWQFQVPYVAGFGNAREANDNKGIPQGTVVLLTFIGYATPFNTSDNPGPGTITQKNLAPPTSPNGAFGDDFDGGNFDDPGPQLPIPMYVFSYQPQQQQTTVPIHDHRSNDPQCGGYSFATYHPGTSLPQQPWSV
jgi:hypothetical protein